MQEVMIRIIISATNKLLQINVNQIVKVLIEKYNPGKAIITVAD